MNAREIAKGLDRDRARAIRLAAQTKTGEYWTPYQRLFSKRQRHLVSGGILTELGEEVRQILQEQAASAQ